MNVGAFDMVPEVLRLSSALSSFFLLHSALQKLFPPECFLCGRAQWPFLSPIDTEFTWLIVWISSAACTAGGKVWGLLP